jgi:AbrB family looped-hinge helix DNA binding protein
VGEAAFAYITQGSGEMPKTTISSKYQITLPARLVRELGLKPGDQLAVELRPGTLVLHPRPKDWLSYTAGSMPGYYGKTKEEIDEYLREVRGSWGTYLDDDEEDESETE